MPAAGAYGTDDGPTAEHSPPTSARNSSRRGRPADGGAAFNSVESLGGSKSTVQLCQHCSANRPAEWHCTNCRFDGMFFCTACLAEKHRRAPNAAEHVVEQLGGDGQPDASANIAVSVSTIIAREELTASNDVAAASGGSAYEAAPLKDSKTSPVPASAAAAAAADEEASRRIQLPFVPGPHDSVPLPMDHLPDRLWRFGEPLSVAYLTWNMANEAAPPEEVVRRFVKPAAHIVCVSTQENGPYVGGGKLQEQWRAVVTEALHSRAHYQQAGAARQGDMRDAAAVSKQRSHATVAPNLNVRRRQNPSAAAEPGEADQQQQQQNDAYHAGPASSSSAATSMTPMASGNFFTPPSDNLEHHQQHRRPVSPSASTQPKQRRQWRWHVVAEEAMMATHMIVFAREDVYRHVAMEHTAVQRTGFGGAVGNKGGIGIAFAVTRPVTKPHVTVEALDGQHVQQQQQQREVSPGEVASPTRPEEEEEPPLGTVSPTTSPPQRRDRRGDSPPPALGGRDDADAEKQGPLGFSAPIEDDAHDAPALAQRTGSSAAAAKSGPGVVSFLFIGAHLAAHQTNIKQRNQDYRAIVTKLGVGSEGPYPQIVREKAGSATERDPESDTMKRNCTLEFDACFFGGDLNYRINGTKFGIEHIIHQHREIRAALANNDQLSIERRRGTVFGGFEEGPLLFKPTYKFSKDKATGEYTDEYDNSKKERLAAYCDRVLYRRHPRYDLPLLQLHYSDAPDVRTSDHRPVTSLFTIGTHAPPAELSAEEDLALIRDVEERRGDCCCGCTVM